MASFYGGQPASEPAKEKGQKSFLPAHSVCTHFSVCEGFFWKRNIQRFCECFPCRVPSSHTAGSESRFQRSRACTDSAAYQARITDKLKSAYTEATWQWDKEPDLHDILAGKTFRILVENMESYTHADISFDRFGRIHVEPMTIGAFSPAESKADADDADTPAPEEPAVVDVRVWYELIGQKILTEQITESHAKGHSKLTIMENGDITVKNQKKKTY